jgi:predicted aspartyl protease
MNELEQYLTQNGYTRIQLNKNKTNHFELDIELNGTNGIFILDTGASGTVIDEKKKDKFNMTINDSNNDGAGVGSVNMSIHETLGNSIKVGEIIIKDIKLILMNLGNVNTAIVAKGGEEVDGVIGADILNLKECIIDYKTTSLFLKNN